MPYQPIELAGRLKSEGDAVQAFFKELQPGQWEQEVYLDGDGWRARDILAHFIAAERGFQLLIENVASGGPGAEPGFDIDAYNSRTVRALREEDAPMLLSQFTMVRERTAAMVGALSAESLEARGNHPALGEATVEQMARMIYHHNSLHLRDLKRALRGAKAGAQSQNEVHG